MRLIFFATCVASVCLTRKQCLASALDEFKKLNRSSGCVAIKSDHVQPVGEWSMDTVKRGIFQFRIFCADRRECPACSIALDGDNLYSVYGYDTSAFTRRGNTITVIPLPTQ